MSWKEQADIIIKHAWDTAQLNIDRHYKNYLVDRTLRVASDIISSEGHTNGAIKTCIYWSEAAVELYKKTKEDLIAQGKSHTHKSIVSYKPKGQKSLWIVEHEHPLQIPKAGLLSGWSVDQITEWMHKYGKCAIITREEDDRLPRNAKTLEEAMKRYSNTGIKIVVRPFPFS